MVNSRAFVSYLRVSTQKQGRSGLGLEAQRAALIFRFVQTFTETESGADDTRIDVPVPADA